MNTVSTVLSSDLGPFQSRIYVTIYTANKTVLSILLTDLSYVSPCPRL